MMNRKTNIGKRFIAGIIDYGIIFTVTYLICMLLGTPTDTVGEYELTGLPVLIPIAYWLLMTVIIEVSLGATLGNGIVGLKPVPIKNYNSKITFSQSLRRHLLDIADMMLFGIVAIIVIKNTEHRQRIGDIWAGTTVISVKDSENKKIVNTGSLY